MYLVDAIYSQKQENDPEAAVFYTLLQEAFPEELPPLETILWFHRDPDKYLIWTRAGTHSYELVQGLNRGHSSTYDYDLFLPGKIKVHLMVRACPLYEIWSEQNRPADWQEQQEHEQPICDYVSIQSPDDSLRAMRWGNARLTPTYLSRIVDLAEKRQIPIRIEGYADDALFASSSLLHVNRSQLLREATPTGLVHWRLNITELEIA